VVDNQNPAITCPANISQTATTGQCSKSITVPNPSASDNCGIVKQTWTMSGATTGSSPTTGINVVGTKTFNCGVTTITYQVWDAAGRTASCSFTINLAGSSSCFNNHRLITNTNVNPKTMTTEVTKLEVTAFPNPTENYFNVKVKSPNKETVEIRMYDMLGKVVQQDRGAPEKTYRFGDHVVGGIYFIEVRQGGQTAIIKVMKQ
jgi:hypothetical protein